VRIWRIGMAQVNTTVGDLGGNATKVRETLAKARSLGVDLVAFPELTITGYPPEDLLLKPRFISDNIDALHSLLPDSAGLTAVIGFVDRDHDIYNSAAILHDGKLVGVYHKIFLPNYGVFDEDRYFKEGDSCPVFVIEGVTVGVNVCEDIWYPVGPASVQAALGAQLLININGSPFHVGKHLYRERMLATRAADSGFTLCYVNLVGARMSLCSTAQPLDRSRGETAMRGHPFTEELIVVTLTSCSVRWRLHSPSRARRYCPSRRQTGQSPTIVVSSKARASAAGVVAPTDAVRPGWRGVSRPCSVRDYVHKLPDSDRRHVRRYRL
jgi:NAD+ synthase (glutamine-hydrolysing)